MIKLSIVNELLQALPSLKRGLFTLVMGNKEFHAKDLVLPITRKDLRSRKECEILQHYPMGAMFYEEFIDEKVKYLNKCFNHSKIPKDVDFKEVCRLANTYLSLGLSGDYALVVYFNSLNMNLDYELKKLSKTAKNTCEAFASFEQAAKASKLFASSMGFATKDIINAMKKDKS
ncbi:MAG: hypothetical protein PHE73_03425 [Sulfurovaceae bacterium]|nr:hypothetical protein [Sulfurovaceae bacterium]